MINFNPRVEVHVCTQPIDMRASFDRLSGLVSSTLTRDPLSGHLFVFVNRSRTTCKSMYWDGTGLVIIHKRLEVGLFSKFNRLWGNQIVLTGAEFYLFLEGTDLSKRFIESPEEFRLKPNKAIAS